MLKKKLRQGWVICKSNLQSALVKNDGSNAWILYPKKLLKLNLWELQYFIFPYSKKLVNFKLWQLNLNKKILIHMQRLTFAFCFCSEYFYELNILSSVLTSCKIIAKCIPAPIWLSRFRNSVVGLSFPKFSTCVISHPQQNNELKLFGMIW